MVFELNKFSVQKALLENEYFKDNNERIKRENTKIERARKAEEDANEVLEEFIPKLEAVAGDNDGESEAQELKVESVI